MKKIVSIIICMITLWAIPVWAQADEQSDKTLSYVSTFKSNQFITQWLICGPFPNPDNAGRNIDYLTTAGGEAQIRPKVGMAHPSAAVPDSVVKWREASAYAHGFLDFMQLPLPHERVVAYAFCYIKSPQAMDIILKVGSDDGVKVWLNGKLVHDKEVGRSARPDEDRIPARLLAGENALLIKVDQSIGGWGLYFQVSHAFSLEKGVFLADARFGPVLAGVEGLALATLSIFNTKDTEVVIDKIELEENNWLETSSVSIGELAPRSSQTLRFQIKNKPIQVPAPSESIKVYVSAYRKDTPINRIPITASITNVLLQLDGTERGKVVRGFKASSDDVVLPYLFYLPTDYTPKGRLPLLVALNSTYSDEPNKLDVYFNYGLAQHADAEGFAVMCLNGSPGVEWDEVIVHNVLDALAIVQSRLPIDVDRIYLFGAGRGGDVAYKLGLQYPDIFAAMAVAEGAGPTDLTKNALNLPLYIVNGVWLGAGYNELQAFRKMVRLFSSYNCILKHQEYPDIKMTWVFGVIVGFVVLIGLGVGCLRLIKIKSQTLQAEPDIPTLTAGFRGIWLIAMKELRSQLLAEKFMLTTLLCLGMVLMSFWLMTHDYQGRLT